MSAPQTLFPNLDLTWAEKVAYLGHQFRQGVQQACPVEERWEGEHYIRTMRIPKGTYFLGRPHRYGHECRLIDGECILYEEHSRKYLVPPNCMWTQPGYQMVLYAVTDVVGATYHPRHYTEADIFGPTEELERLGEEVAERLQRRVA